MSHGWESWNSEDVLKLPPQLYRSKAAGGENRQVGLPGEAHISQRWFLRHGDLPAGWAELSRVVVFLIYHHIGMARAFITLIHHGFLSACVCCLLRKHPRFAVFLLPSM